MGFGFLLVIGGIASGIIFVILAWSGKLQAVHGEISTCHGIYVEAFAVWLLLHQIIGLFAGLIVTETNTMVVSAGGLMATGVAAFWPVVRGVTWKQMCADIGLHRGTKNWLFEIVFGMVGYVTMLPFLLLNGLVLILVMKLMSQGQADEFAMPQMPSHPLNEWVTESGWFAKFMIIFLASGVAPVLEETMFRGFL